MIPILIHRLSSRIHLADAKHRGSRCFTASPTGYEFLVKWSKEVSQGEEVAFVLLGLAHYGRLLADWLTCQGERVVVLPVRVLA